MSILLISGICASWVAVDAGATMGRESTFGSATVAWSCVIHSFVSEWFESDESFVTVTVAYVCARDGCLDIFFERTRSFGGGGGGMFSASSEIMPVIP